MKMDFQLITKLVNLQLQAKDWINFWLKFWVLAERLFIFLKVFVKHFDGKEGREGGYKEGN